MTENERLTKLIQEAEKSYHHDMGIGISEFTAGFLLKNGVVVPPCKIGDTVYECDGIRVYESMIKNIIYDLGHGAFDESAIGSNIFLTKEEAEKKLKSNRK